jgi:magnesium-transporting ATPase (P-type)
VSIHDIDFTVEIGEPNNEIYKFRGVSQLSGKNASSSSQGNLSYSPIDFALEQKSITAETNTQLGLGQAKASDVEILELENTAWSSTTVASGDFYGLVIYVGKHTRIQMNSSTPRIKFPQADFEINYLSKLLFLLCLFLSFMFILIDGFRFGWFVKFV